ncbi:hypothetical protein PR048_018236 [Dryococelus australis]|uniref:Integrase catalytic domain-containing protein n=1 Tax=Dryococelus australis TaxID=614101 RepID=A0ABQ9HBV7_9NEOP|nr:hypothetical protein PR048_018236 [Dryococelus australis]
MEMTTTASKLFEKITLDIFGPLTVTDEKNICILTFQDELTKFVTAIPLPNQEAETVAKAFVTEIILRYGTPQTLLSDQGTNFMKTTAFHTQSNGSLRRSHRTLLEYLRHYVHENQTNWAPSYLLHVIFITPGNIQPDFELLYGFKPTLPTSLTQHPSVIARARKWILAQHMVPVGIPKNQNIVPHSACIAREQHLQDALSMYGVGLPIARGQAAIRSNLEAYRRRMFS